MSTRRRLVLSLSALGLAVAAIAFANRDALLLRAFDRAVDSTIGRDKLAGLDPAAIHVGFCGTGSPLPSRDRASACTAVLVAGKLFIFDAGEGAGETLSLMGMPLGKTEGLQPNQVEYKTRVSNPPALGPFRRPWPAGAATLGRDKCGHAAAHYRAARDR